MKNFWSNNNSPTSGSLFGKKSSVSPAATPPPAAPPATAPGAKASSIAPGAKSSSMGRMSSSSLSAAATPPPGKNATLSDTGARAKFDHDYACGVFVGAFDIPGMSVTVDVVEITDPGTKRVERTENWLKTNDMLAILTREFDKAQKRLFSIPKPPPPQPGRPAPPVNKDWEDANRRVTEVRDQVVCVLHSRRAYHRVKEAGIRVLIEI